MEMFWRRKCQSTCIDSSKFPKQKLTYCHQKFGICSADVFWKVDLWNNPVSLHPPQSVSQWMLWQLENRGSIILFEWGHHAALQAWFSLNKWWQHCFKCTSWLLSFGLFVLLWILPMNLSCVHAGSRDTKHCGANIQQLSKHFKSHF